MSEGMIIRRGGGGSAWAMVLVNYPSGSTLTATNVSGKKDISATQRLYYVKTPSGETQTCVFTITDGTQTKSETVSGITVGTARTLTLSYRLWLYNRGDECTVVTGGWSIGGYAVKQNDYIYIGISGYSSTGEAYTNSAVDLSDYDNLYFVYENISVASSNTYNLCGLIKESRNPPIGNYGSTDVTQSYWFDVSARHDNTLPSYDLIDISSGFNRKIDVHLQHYSTELSSSYRLVEVYAE